MDRAYSINEILAGVKDRKEASEKALYRFLLNAYYKMITTFEPQEMNAQTIFQDAFYILLERIKAGRIALMEEEDTRKIVLRMAHRYIHQGLFDMKRSVYSVTVGVEKNIEIALNHLSAEMGNQSIIKYSAYLEHNYNLGVAGHKDLISQALTQLIKNIQEQKFALSPADPNEMNKNKIYKYFRAILFGIARKESRGSTKDRKLLNQLKESENKEDAFEEMVYEEKKSLHKLALEALNNLDEVGRYIIKATYLHRKKPIQIAKTIPFPEYRKTEKIVEKKAACLGKLSTDFGSIMYEVKDKGLFNQFKSINNFVLEKLKDPCLTILKNVFSPIKVSYAEIVEIIQTTLKPEEAQKLTTPTQVKKRKYRCLQALHEGIWHLLLNPQNQP